jgi:hypothetical protein
MSLVVAQSGPRAMSDLCPLCDPHVADKVLNHQGGTISGVAAVYQRHDFLAERKKALEMWGAHVQRTVGKAISKNNHLPKVA